MEREFIDRFGRAAWKAHTEAIADMWRAIEEKMEALHVDWRGVRIYQDGLPVCGREEEIVNELADLGSPNHRLIASLLRRGAELEGTEDPSLLRKEYDSLDAQIHRRSTAARPVVIELLEARDRYIAARINETLKEGEVGLLFIGLAHQVDRCLPGDIQVEPIISRLPLREERKQ